jgi:hypothetical protein
MIMLESPLFMNHLMVEIRWQMTRNRFLPSEFVSSIDHISYGA